MFCRLQPLPSRKHFPGLPDVGPNTRDLPLSQREQLSVVLERLSNTIQDLPICAQKLDQQDRQGNSARAALVPTSSINPPDKLVPHTLL